VDTGIVRREPEFFEDRELELIYIAKRLKEALHLEDALTESGVDYAVEADRYKGGVMFLSERIGAYFYVLPEAIDNAQQVIQQTGLKLLHR